MRCEFPPEWPFSLHRVSRNNLETVRAFPLKLVPSLESRNCDARLNGGLAPAAPCASARFAQLFERMRELGKLVLIIGVLTTFVGLVMWSGFAPKWLGRLPGEIRIERGNSSFYFPIVTCIVLSIVLSLLLSLLSIFRR